MIRLIANILWFLFGGLITTILWLILGLILCITIIGIPLGLQCFKAAKLSFFPYGKKVFYNIGEHPIANVIWALLAGWWIALIYLIFAIFNFITIINIPHGIQSLKMMKLSLFPFGATVGRK